MTRKVGETPFHVHLERVLLHAAARSTSSTASCSDVGGGGGVAGSAVSRACRAVSQPLVRPCTSASTGTGRSDDGVDADARRRTRATERRWPTVRRVHGDLRRSSWTCSAVLEDGEVRDGDTSSESRTGNDGDGA
jgi:hypothetical protein